MRDLVPIGRVWDRLARLEVRLLEATTSKHTFVTDMAQHLLGGGKRYRPLLAQVAAELGPVETGAPVEAGVSVELIHVGSLYHDDVIDEAESRRGVTSVNANWSNTVAILAGDFLLARASEIAAPLGEEAVALLARTYAQLCEGQMLELRLSNDLDQGTGGYYQVIEDKTASLIRTAARLGAMTGGADDHAVAAATTWGHEVGMVFQLTDDVLDLIASEAMLGKPAGSDIGEGTYTLALLHALDGARGNELRRLLAGGKPHNQDVIDQVIGIVRVGPHIDDVLNEARARIARADEAIAALPETGVTKVFSSLANYLIERVESVRDTAIA